MALSRGQLVGAAVAAAVAAASIGIGVVAATSGGGGAKGITRSPGVASPAPGGGAGQNAPSPDTGAAAIAPIDNTAVIYNTFGGQPADVAMVQVVKDQLTREGYSVTVYQDPAEGRNGVGENSLENFISMAKASVLVIDTHGLSAGGDTSTKVCQAAGKGLDRVSPTPDPDPCGTTPVPPAPTPSVVALPSHEAGLLVSWYNDAEAFAAAVRQFIAVDHYDPSWFEHAAGPRSDGTRGQALLLSAAGIEHFFAGSHLALVDALACYSLGVAPSFHARSYFGYSDRACVQTGVPDTETLFNRLTGTEGVPERTTVAAMAKGGFQDPDLHLADGAQPVVLSPAVTSTTPEDGTQVAKGSTTSTAVTFDAQMETSDATRVVTASGCNATIEKPAWNGDGTKLSFDLKVPKDAPDGIITLTVGKDAARADPGTFPNHRLDGNQDPTGQSGLEPNRDDYVWSLPCSNGIYPLKLSYSGTFTDAYSVPADRQIYTHKAFSSNTTYTFSESRAITVTLNDGAMTTTNGDPSVTVKGTSTTLNQSGAASEIDCTWKPGPTAGSSIIVNGLLPNTPNPTIRLQAPIPEMVGSGVCDEQSPAPYLFWHPDSLERYDPDGQLQALYGDIVDRLDLQELRKTPFTQKFAVGYTQHDRGGGTDQVTASATLTISLSGSAPSSQPPPTQPGAGGSGGAGAGPGPGTTSGTRSFDFPGPALDNLQRTTSQLGGGGDQIVPVEDEHWPDAGTLLDEICIVPDPKNPTGPCPPADDLASGNLSLAPAPAANSSGNLQLHLTPAGEAAIAAGTPVVVLLRVTFLPQQGAAIIATRVVTLSPKS